ncbi:carboxylesterase family protein [Streptomyces huasconensis]|nr:carboxylesterase family protein [Streptomyces huasconensis]
MLDGFLAGFGLDPAEARAAYLGRAPGGIAWRSPVLDGALGACHLADVGFVFGNLSDPLLGADAPRDLSLRMREAWISFARTGRPGTPGGVLPPWPAYGERRSVMRLGDGAPVVQEDPAADTRRLWETLRRPLSGK